MKLTVKGQNDSIEVPLNLNIAKNKDPDFITSCKNSCSLSEIAPSGTIVIDSSRRDDDVDDLTYSLENNYGNKFEINSQTGEVKLSNPLDYENKNSYLLKVIGTDSKGATKEVTSIFNVENYTYTLTDSAPSSAKVKKGNFDDNQRILFVEGDLSSLNSQERILANYEVDVSGTTYSLSGTDADKVEIDSDGILRLKGDTTWNVDESNTNYASTPFYSVNVNANIPGEGIITKQVNFSPKNVEKNENLVLKFASGFNNVEHSASGKDPFTASATRNVSGSEELITLL